MTTVHNTYIKLDRHTTIQLLILISIVTKQDKINDHKLGRSLPLLFQSSVNVVRFLLESGEPQQKKKLTLDMISF